MRAFDYLRPESIDEAISLLNETDSSSRLLAGGTDLLTLMKHGISEPQRLVDIKRLPELSSEVEMENGGLLIGALTSLTRLEEDELVEARYPALREAARAAASPQLRNMATIGGNLLQRPRCWYYRAEQVQCWLNGGTECFARDGENEYHGVFDESPCVAVHPSDLATALLALEAEVSLLGPGGERTVPIDAFFVPPTDERRTETTLSPDEIVVAVHLPAARAGTQSNYLKAMDRKVWAFALIGVGVQATMENGWVRDARLALGGVAPAPRLMTDAMAMLTGEVITEELATRVADTALDGATPLTKNGYKVPLAKSLIRQALLSL
jgi:xanthine dehydrogenase YagS FAD-binding subunit